MRRLCLMLSAAALTIAAVMAETPAAHSGPMLRFTAKTAAVAGAPDFIRIDLFRWSTDAEREKLMAAWNMKSGAAAPRSGAGRGGRAGARGGRGGAAEDPAPEPANPDDLAVRFRANTPANPGKTARPTPEGSLAAALKETTTVGYLWSSEVAGYALRFAGKVAAPDGAERIILITDRRLGATNDLWTLTAQAPPAAYDFSVIELRVNAKGEGEGRLTLTGKVAPDTAAGIVAPAEYEALPVVLTNVKRSAPQTPEHGNSTNK